MAELHLVAKLGGSLHASPLRGAWIAALERWPGRATLVCGGGPFADAVRAAQPVMGYDDRVAHKMAMLAMEQYALALAALHRGLRLAETPAEIVAAHAAGAIALWRPSKMVESARDIAAGWDVTSDSLSAWLAQRLGANALLMIKSVDAAPGADLVSAGVVDPAFPGFVAKTPVYCAGPTALEDAGDCLARGEIPGARLTFPPATRKIAS